MKTLFSVAAVVMAVLGFSWLLVPVTAFEAGFGISGADVNAAAVYMGRRYAALFFGYAAILWMNRSAQDSPAQRSILFGFFLSSAIMAVLSAMGALTGTTSAMGWFAFFNETLLAVGFGYFFLTTRTTTVVSK